MCKLRLQIILRIARLLYAGSWPRHNGYIHLIIGKSQSWYDTLSRSTPQCTTAFASRIDRPRRSKSRVNLIFDNEYKRAPLLFEEINCISEASAIKDQGHRYDRFLQSTRVVHRPLPNACLPFAMLRPSTRPSSRPVSVARDNELSSAVLVCTARHKIKLWAALIELLPFWHLGWPLSVYDTLCFVSEPSITLWL